MSTVGILLQARHGDSEEEARKCTVRILGDTDILWVRFGDSSKKEMTVAVPAPPCLQSPGILERRHCGPPHAEMQGAEIMSRLPVANRHALVDSKCYEIYHDRHDLQR